MILISLQEYIPSKPSHVVRSLMYLIDMLLAEALDHDPEDNRNLHTWIVVSYHRISRLDFNLYTCHRV